MRSLSPWESDDVEREARWWAPPDGVRCRQRDLAAVVREKCGTVKAWVDVAGEDGSPYAKWQVYCGESKGDADRALLGLV